MNIIRRKRPASDYIVIAVSIALAFYIELFMEAAEAINTGIERGFLYKQISSACCFRLLLLAFVTIAVMLYIYSNFSRMLHFAYRYRYAITLTVLVVGVACKISGSSISAWKYWLKTNGDSVKRLALFMHFDSSNCVSQDDLFLLRGIHNLGSDIIVVTNCPLSDADQTKLRQYALEVILRENAGYDFAAWREAMLQIGFSNMETYDQVILVNNSIRGPYFPLNEVFKTMENRDPNVDFWGITLFPYYADGSYLGITSIAEHIQSYFMVFKRQVVQSDAFQRFWENVGVLDSREQAIINCEICLTKTLHDAGFTYAPYIRESAYMSHCLNCYSIPYTYPAELLLLRDPFVKKKCKEHASDQENLRLQALLSQLHEEPVAREE